MRIGDAEQGLCKRGREGAKWWRRKGDRRRSKERKEGEINHIVTEFPAVCRWLIKSFSEPQHWALSMSTIFPLHSYYPLHNLLLMRMCVFSAPHRLIASPLAKLFLKSYLHSLPRWLISFYAGGEFWKAVVLGECLKTKSTCKGEALRLSLGILPFLHWPGFKLNWQYNSTSTKSSTLLNTFIGVIGQSRQH